MPEREPRILYRARDSARADIEHGIYFSGALPSIDKLAEKYGVSRVTMRNALKLLEEEGLVSIRQGKGTFVNIPSQESGVSVTSELPHSFNEAIGRYAGFLANPQIPREIRAQMLQIVDAQIGLVTQSQKLIVNVTISPELQSEADH